MGVGKRRLILLCVIVLVVVMIRLPTVDAAIDEYIATAFTDSSGDWGSESSAYDGDFGTYADNVIFANGDDYPSAYASGFDSGVAGSGTISQVDIIVRMSLASSSASDEWGITLDVGASTGNVLSALSSAAYSLNNNTFTDVTEPNGGGWSWVEIRAAEIHLDSNKVGGKDNDVWNVYEFVFKITTSAAGTDYTAYPDGDITVGGSTSLIADFVKTLIEGFTLTGTASLIVAFTKTLIEGFALAGTTSVFVIIQILIVEGFALTGGVSLVASYVVTLVQGFALGGTVALAAAFVVTLVQNFSLGGTIAVAVAYVKTLVEGFSLSGTISAFKVFIVNLVEGFSFGVGVDITRVVGTAVVGSMIYQLFLSTEVWGYLGPAFLVIGGYVLLKRDLIINVLWFVLECLVVSQYLLLVDATPEYWWHIIIILIGGLITFGFAMVGRKR